MVALGWKEDGSHRSSSKLLESFTGCLNNYLCAVSSMLNDIGGVFCENCDIAERKEYIDESMRRYFGVADHAIDTEEAKRLWEETEKMISSF